MFNLQGTPCRSRLSSVPFATAPLSYHMISFLSSTFLTFFEVFLKFLGFRGPCLKRSDIIADRSQFVNPFFHFFSIFFNFLFSSLFIALFSAIQFRYRSFTLCSHILAEIMVYCRQEENAVKPMPWKDLRISRRLRSSSQFS